MRNPIPLPGAGLLGIVALAGIVSCSSVPEPSASPSAGGLAVRSPQGFYEITLASDAWQLGTGSDANGADLAADRRDGRGSVAVFTYSGMRLRLEGLVEGRRGPALAENARIRERRYFLDEAGQVPASLARYTRGNDVVLVLTFMDGKRAVEAVGACALGGGFEGEVLQMLESIRLVGEGS